MQYFGCDYILLTVYLLICTYTYGFYCYFFIKISLQLLNYFQVPPSHYDEYEKYKGSKARVRDVYLGS
jgi:hypothetical protein